MKELAEKIVEKINGKVVLACTALYAVAFYLINLSKIGVAELERITNGGKILDLEFGYTLDEAYGCFEYLGEIGRNFYLTKILPLDIVFPVCMMLFNLSIMAMLLKKATGNNSIFRYLVFLPLIDMTLDWSENVGFALMLANYPDKLTTVCSIGSCITQVKLLAVLSIITIDMVLLLVICIKKVISLIKK